MATLLVLCGILISGSWLVFKSGIFEVKSIQISGNKDVPTDAVRTILMAEIPGNGLWDKILGFKNILAWPGVLSASALQTAPGIKNISIKKDYKNKSVEIGVVERPMAGVWCYDGSDNWNCLWFDDEGVAFRRGIATEGSFIRTVYDYSGTKVGLGQKVLPDSELPNLLSIFKVIDSGGINQKEIAIKDRALEELEIQTYDGPLLYFSLRFPSYDTLAVINDLKSKPGFKKISYIDFRVEHRAYYK